MKGLRNTGLRNILEWVERLGVWNDDTLNEFLKTVYNHDCAEGYLNEKRDKLKRSVYVWFCELDTANINRLADLLTYTPSEWWLSLDQDFKTEEQA